MTFYMELKNEILQINYHLSVEQEYSLQVCGDKQQGGLTATNGSWRDYSQFLGWLTSATPQEIQTRSKQELKKSDSKSELYYAALL